VGTATADGHRRWDLGEVASGCDNGGDAKRPHEGNHDHGSAIEEEEDEVTCRGWAGRLAAHDAWPRRHLGLRRGEYFFTQDPSLPVSPRPPFIRRDKLLTYVTSNF